MSSNFLKWYFKLYTYPADWKISRRFLHGRALPIVFLLLLSYFSIVHNFWNPAALFWDENYHIASAQKYINGIYFMEPHPPLGKMLIGLGEKIFDRNAVDNQFINTDYGQSLPPGFSFFGYRFFPVMLAWLTVPLLYLIFHLLTRRNLWAILLTFLYMFDNAMLVHLRSAMLESTLIFFSCATILAFLLANEWKDDRRKFLWASLFFGAAFGCVMATKLFGLILVLLVPLLLPLLWPRLKQFGVFLLAGGAAFLLVYCGIWYAHFAIGKTVNPKLPDAGYYQASDAYKTILQTKKTTSLTAFPTMLSDSLDFVGHYQAGVPRLNLCKTDENGSPFFFWPFGGRSINYRWQTDGDGAYRYLYLQANPVVWLVGLIGLALSVVLLLGNIFLSPEEKLESPYMLGSFLFLYLAYMGAVSTIDRVMYLYHYFIPLLLTFFLFALAFKEIKHLGTWKLREEQRGIALLCIAFVVFLSYQFYRPLTYYEPIGDKAFQRRALLSIWELKCVNCPNFSPLVVPQNPLP